ncbi:MAG: nitronate monooxygenase [Deltaproteobacteria bacterium]|nr:nitronate monooxygenase [Nannocystaceae bacterium]
MSPEQIVGIAADIRARTDRPFALNLWVSDHDPGGFDRDPAQLAALRELFAPYFAELGLEVPELPERAFHPFEQQVEALLEARPHVFSFVFGVPRPAILEACRQRGIVTLGAATSIAEARALDEAGVELVVASGSEAGGHRPSFLAAAEDSLMGTFALTPLVADRVQAPVVAAGGIVDRRGVAAALQLGAQAAQIGTAFLACEESGASDEHRALLFSDRAEHTMLTRSFTGRLARGLRNRWTDERHGHPTAAFPLHAWFTSALKRAAAAAHRTDLVSLWSGQAAPNLRHKTAAELFAALVQEN